MLYGFNNQQKGFSMKGGIYSDQKCPECGTKFKDNRRGACLCPNHPDRQATRFKVIFMGTTKRFSSYQEAERFLTVLRAKEDEGLYDQRDYSKDNPLSFDKLVEEFMTHKTEVESISVSQMREYKRYLGHASNTFQKTNIKTITSKMIERCILSYGMIDKKVSNKTRSNMSSCLHSFWTWLKEYDEERPIIERMPKFPKFNYQLTNRTLTDKATQQRVLDRMKETEPYKIWLAAKFLSTYVSLRPDDIRRIKEKDIDREIGLIIIQRPTKRKKQKGIWLTQDDKELINNIPASFPDMPFFRHESDCHYNATQGQVFGRDSIASAWNRACISVGLEGVSVYPGTRHTSATALQSNFSPDNIKTYATQHDTNKAFERYFFPDKEMSIKIAEAAAGKGNSQNDKVVSIKR